MNLKEVSELRRRFRMDRNAISRIYGCFVNSSREIVSYIDESMGILPQDEAEKYLNLLKKALSGKLGKNLIDIIFSTEQVADSDEHRLLMALRDSQLKDGDIREEFYQKIINSLDLGDSNYLILLAYDTYDVPHKNKNDEMDADASDAVAERCETFVSKEMARMPVPLKMAIRTENSRPEITGAGIANLRSTWDRRTMARPAKMTSAAKPRLVRYSN